MSDQGDLFGEEPRRNRRKEGDRRKKASMDQADEAADEEWKAAFMTAIYTTAKERRYLTSDDVWERLSEGVDTHERRAAGQRMLEAAKNGWIIKADVPGINSTRPTLHASPRTVWKSLLHAGI